uniref:Uncharacterized protein n=1 Tax=Arundo donax TaxID=35708 RepID=A0A0A9BL29_ARUDO
MSLALRQQQLTPEGILAKTTCW